MMRIFQRRFGDNDAFGGIAMGDKVKDTLSGFTGIVLGRAEHLTGCNQVYVLPASDSDNELKDGVWFDVERVEKLVDQVVERSQRRTGADIPPPRTSGPKL